MAKYRNKKNGRVATLLEEDKKYKTVLIEYEDDGEQVQLSTSTMKRWWEEVDEDEDYEEEEDEDLDEEEDDEDEDYEDDDEDEDDVDDEDEDSDDEDDEDEDDEEDLDEDEDDSEDDEEEDDDEEDPEEDDDDEDVEDEEEEEEPAPKKSKKQAPKSKKAPAPRKRAEDSADVKSLVEFIEAEVEAQGGDIFQPQSQPKNRAFKIGGHMYARLLYSTKSVTIACREEAVAGTGLKPTKTINHMFSELYAFEKLDKTAKANIKKLLKASYDFQLKKNNSTGDKKKAKKTKEAPAPKKSTKNSTKSTKNTRKEK